MEHNTQQSPEIFDGYQIANFVLDICESKGFQITNLSLQKIIYFCHVWTLIKMRKPLIKHNFEAWKHGPVLQYLYSQFKEYGEKPIKKRATKLNLTTGEQCVAEYQFNKETESFLNHIVEIYGDVPASQLVKLSHVKGGPWEQVWNHAGKTNPGMRINDEDIINFYSDPAQYKEVRH